jgi:hypothetical protein
MVWFGLAVLWVMTNSLLCWQHSLGASFMQQVIIRQTTRCHKAQDGITHLLRADILKTFCMIKPTRCANFSNLFLKWNSTCFRQFLCPSSGVIHCTISNGICHTDEMAFHLIHDTSQQHYRWTVPEAFKYSYVLLMMGERVAPNM